MHEVVKEYKSSCGINAYEAIEPTKELFALARAQGLPIFYTTTETRKEVPPAAVHATNRQITGIDPDDFEIYKDFAPQPEDIIIYKERASGFYGTPLIAHLTRLGISSLIVCGESTSGCVRAQRGGRLFQRLPRLHRRGVRLRPQHHLPQGEPVRSAPQVRRRHETGGVKQHFEAQPLKKAV